MKLEKRGSSYYARGRINGVDKRVALGTKDEAEAESRLAAVSLIGHMPTLQQAMEQYLSRPEGAGNTDIVNARTIIRLIGDLPLATIRASEINRRFTEERLKQVVPGSVRRELATLQAALNFAVAIDLLAHPIKVLRPRVDDARYRWLTRDERDEMIDQATEFGEHFRAVVAFLFLTGARLGEALACTPDDIVGKAVCFSTRKGRNGKLRKRLVPITPRLYSLLRPSGDLILPSPWGRKWSLTELRRRWADLCDICGQEDFRIHDCRHTFCSLLIQDGIDPMRVARLSGHSNLQMLSRYTHLDVTTDAALIAAMS